jgi:hypothetical protein
MNYLHGIYLDDSNGDLVVSQQVTAMDTYAGQWITGFDDGTGARPRCGPRGAVAISKLVAATVRHRDFPA